MGRDGQEVATIMPRLPELYLTSKAHAAAAQRFICLSGNKMEYIFSVICSVHVTAMMS